MPTETLTVTLPTKDMQYVLNVLARQPFAEVSHIIQQIFDQQNAPAAEADAIPED
jgi:hypothetical protein